MPKDTTKKETRAKRGEPGGKKKKDPNAPKKPLSAYMFFSSENRPTVKEENPQLSFGDLGKELGRRWKEMTASDKKPYEEMALRDKGRYEKEKGAYDAAGGAAQAKADDEDDD
jgi:hypothetical protein